jgi:hypothetical protein
MHAYCRLGDPAVKPTCHIVLPSEKFRLEEINMPAGLASALAGQAVLVEVLPEELPMARRLEVEKVPDGFPMLFEEDGVAWNDHWPVRVLYTDPDGRTWRLPRHWVSSGVSPVVEASIYDVGHESTWLERWCPPTWWDLQDINIGDVPAAQGGRGAAQIKMSLAPGEVPKVFWRSPSGNVWRIPHDWRTRRVKLPGCDGLLRNSLPQDIAEEFAGRIVAVNYHPGSLCCLSDGYRVHDGRGGRWPVRAADCVVAGFGDEAERHA